MSNLPNALRIRIKIGPDVKLHDVGITMIDTAHLIEERTLVLIHLIRCQRLICTCFLEDCFNLLFGVIRPGEMRDAVIGNCRARRLLEILQSLFERFEHTMEISNAYTRHIR